MSGTLVNSPKRTSSLAGGESNATTNSVRVALRIRPNDEASSAPSRFQRPVIHASSESTLSVEQVGKSAAQAFSFDRVFAPEDGQSEVYTAVEDLIAKFLQGFNVTILAYGQTSSGKSYTMGTDFVDLNMLDSEERTGIIPRAVNDIYRQLEEQVERSQGSLSYKLTNSYIELYNEDLIDLLVPETSTPDERPQVIIREDRTGTIICQGLTETAVNEPRDIMLNLEAGSRIRQTGATDMNAKSSRSHAIFTLTLVQTRYTGSGPAPPTTPTRMLRRPASRLMSPIAGRPGTPSDRPGSRLAYKSFSNMSGRNSPAPGGDDDWVTTTSKLHLVDLAGSERLKRTSAVGDRAKESISINAGLHALGNVISALATTSKHRTAHVPYRDSKLTRLLQDSLGGNAYTLMMACISPTEYNLPETLNTLKYAERAKAIKNIASINEVEVGWDDLQHVQELVIKLRAELKQVKSGVAVPDSPSRAFGGSASNAELLDLQERYANLEQKYAALRADTTRPSSLPPQRQARASLSPADFATAVEPVVDEYEKSISALETQLSLTKAALQHTETELKALEQERDEAKLKEEADLLSVETLKASLAKAHEREQTTESYIQDLESKLNAITDGQEKQQSLLLDLKKELAKSKEVGKQNEEYIQSLESQLAAATKEADHGLSSSASRRLSVIDSIDEARPDLEQTHHMSDLKAALHQLQIKEQQVAELERLLAESRAARATDDAGDDLEELAQTQEEAALQTRLNRSPIRAKHMSLASSGDSAPTYEDLQYELEEIKEQLKQSGQRPRDSRRRLSHSASATSLNGKYAFGHNRMSNSQPPSATLPYSPTRSRLSMPVSVGYNNQSFLGTSPRKSLSFVTSSSSPVDYSSEQPWPSSFPPRQQRNSFTSTPRDYPSSPDSLKRSGNGTRSYDSLVKEIGQLQQVLAQRETEMDQLSQQVARLSEQATLDATATLSPQAEATPTTTGPPLSPDQQEVYQDLKKEISNDAASPGLQETERLEDLLRAMARKEAFYREQAEETSGELQKAQKQHDELKRLTQNQIDNLTKEVDALQVQLATATTQLEQFETALREERESHASTKEMLESLSADKEVQLLEIQERQRQSEEERQQQNSALRQQELDQLAETHNVALQQLHAQHAETVQEQQDRHRQEVEVLRQEQQDQHRQEVEVLRQEHETAMSSLQNSHAEAMAELSRQHAEALDTSQRQKQQELNAHHEDHETKMKALQADLQQQEQDFATQRQQLTREHSEQIAVLENLARQKEQALAEAQAQVQVQQALQEAALKESMPREQVEQAAQVEKTEQHAQTEVQIHVEAALIAEQNKVASLTNDIARLTVELDALSQERNALQAQIGQSTGVSAEEYQEALEALATLETTLTEVQDERDDLKISLDQTKAHSAELESQLETALHERDALTGQVEKLQESVNVHQQQRLQTDADLSGTPDLTRSESGSSQATEPADLRPAGATAVTLDARFSVNSPPPFDPPKIGLPPLPTAPPVLPAVDRIASPTSSASPEPSVNYHGTTGTEIGSTRTRTPVHRSSRASSVVSTLADVPLDIKWQRKIEDQDAIISKLTQRLSYCEGDLRANIDLVNTLETALNETERNLKRGRVQTSELVKERDAAIKQCDSLRQQLATTQSELQAVRDQLEKTKREATAKADADLQQRELAKKQLEARLGELKSRKSKFNCF